MARTVSIETLKQKQELIAKQIKAAQAEQAKKDAESYDLRCRIIGHAVMMETKKNEDFANSVGKIIDKHTKKKRDRKVLELPDT